MSLAAELPKHCAQLSGIDSPWEVKPVELKGGEKRGEIQLGWPWGRAAKELLSKFWAQEEEGWARRFFKEWLGGDESQPTGTDDRRGPNAQAATREAAHLFEAPPPQRRHGGVEFKNPEHQIGRTRFS